MNKLIIGLVCLVLISGCVTPPTRYREDPFNGNFTYSGEPKLGQEFEVVFYVKPLTTFDNTNISVTIFEGLELIEGDTSYVGSLKGPVLIDGEWKWDRKELRMKLKAVKEGTHQVEVTAKGRWTGRSGGSVNELERYWIFITSYEDSGEFSRKPPPGKKTPAYQQPKKLEEGGR